MTADLILSLALIKWLLIWLAVKVIVENNYLKTLLLLYAILPGEFLVNVDTMSYKYELREQFTTDP